MQRFVYAPKVQAYISLDDDERGHQLIDVSDDIISGSVTRRINAMSDTTLVLQNKNAQYLGGDNHGAHVPSAIIKPMDRIVVKLARVGDPFLVFSGYVDEAPYYQVFPGPVTIKASCPLKLLQYTFFDPGLVYMRQFFSSFGWTYDPQSGVLYDSGGTGGANNRFGNFDVGGGVADVIRETLIQIGGWDADHIDILNLPAKYLDKISKAMNTELTDQQVDEQVFLQNLKKLYGYVGPPPGSAATVSTSGGKGTTTTPPPNPTGGGNPGGGTMDQIAYQIGTAFAAAGMPPTLGIATALLETGGTLDPDSANGSPFPPDCAHDAHLGLFQNGIKCGRAPIPQAGIDYFNAHGQTNLRCNGLSTAYTVTEQIAGPVGSSWFPAYRPSGADANTTDPRLLQKWAEDAQGAPGQYGSFPAHLTHAQALWAGFSKTPTQTTNTSTSIARHLASASPGTPTASKPNSNIAAAVVAAASAERGTVGPPKITKYEAVTNATGPQWASSYIAYVYKQAGFDLVKATSDCTTVDAIQNFADSNSWTSTSPAPSNIVTFKTNGGGIDNGRAAIVSNVVGNTVTVLEGNVGDAKVTEHNITYSTGGYRDPLRDASGLVGARIDQGVDYAAAGGGPIYALGAGTVDYFTTSSGYWPSGFYMSYTLTDGPAAGKSIFISEYITPARTFKIGDSVTTDTVLGNLVAGTSFSGNGIETGWGHPGTETAMAHGDYTGGGRITAYGRNFAALMKSIGGNPGNEALSAPGPVEGTVTNGLPDWSGFPSWKWSSSPTSVVNFIDVPGVGPPPTSGGGTGTGSSGGTGTGGSGVPGDKGTGTGAGGGNPAITDLTVKDVVKIGLQTAWFTLQLQSNDTLLSMSLTGARAIANDVPLLNWISQIVPASGRVFMTKPDGTFFAFYPDRFGIISTEDEIIYEQTVDKQGNVTLNQVGTATYNSPYFRVADIELIDLTIQHNDLNLTTHVFASGPRANPMQGIGILDKMNSTVASVESAAFPYFINVDVKDPQKQPPGEFDLYEFLRKYGARPFQYDLPDVRHPMLLWMAAWTKFTELWALQYTADASFTFLPEVLPGGLVDLGGRITMFVEEVTHNFDLQAGFTTHATLSSPAAVDKKRFKGLPASGGRLPDQAYYDQNVVGKVTNTSNPGIPHA